MVVQPGDLMMALLVIGAGTTVLFPIARAIGKRIERGTPPALPPRDTDSPGADERLRRIEQAVEAMAIEVERVSEGQRFVTKLLADRGSAPPAAHDSQQRIPR